MAESGFISLELSRHRRLLQLARQLYSLQKQTMIPLSQLIYIALVVSLIP